MANRPGGRAGRVVIEPIFDDIWFDKIRSNNEIHQLDGLMPLPMYSLNKARPYVFQELSLTGDNTHYNQPNDVLLVYLYPVKQDGKWFFIDGDGNDVFANRFDEIKYPFCSDTKPHEYCNKRLTYHPLVAVKNNGKWCLMDTLGRIEPINGWDMGYHWDYIHLKQECNKNPLDFSYVCVRLDDNGTETYELWTYETQVFRGK